MMVCVGALVLPLGLTASGRWNPAPRQTLRVSVVDVGEGDCILVRTPANRTMLIDGGGVRSVNRDGETESEIGERVVVPFLRARGIDEIDLMVITHPHGDHIGGLPAVVRDLKVDQVLDGTTLNYPSSGYIKLCRDLFERHIPRLPARRGERIDFGDGVVGDVVNPPDSGQPYGTDFSDKTINNYSAVIRLQYGSTVFLLDGDAEQEAEDNMLAAYPKGYLRADVLKCGHHGSRNASSDEWLSTVQPEFGAISCGHDNVFGHPHPEALARLAAHRVDLYRTDLNGTVEFDSNGKTVVAVPERGGS